MARRDCSSPRYLAAWIGGQVADQRIKEINMSAEDYSDTSHTHCSDVDASGTTPLKKLLGKA